jgi:hypothetical protein
MPARRFALAALLALPLGAALAPLPAAAQYFGRNKVQYETFRFQVLATEHFDVYFYEEERRMAEQAARMAERWYARLARAFDHELRGRQPLILYASHPDFEQTNAIPGEIDESTGGVTESFKRRIVLPLTASPGETDHVIGHELVHAFQFDLRRRGQPNLMDPGLQFPLWFVEGMAEYLSIGPVDPHTAMWMRDAARSGKLPTITRLSHWRYFPYRYGHALWAFVAARWGEARVGEVFKIATARGLSAERALEAVLGASADSISREWQRVTADWAEATTRGLDGSRAGRLVVGPRGERGRINVSPSLSPDGRLVAFLSERDAFSVELFLAEAATGRILRRLTKAALDPHLQSLQFIHSAGAFSPDGRRIAIATVSRGQPTLALIDVGSGRTVQEIRFPDLGEIYHPTWSPDGRRVAFSGLVGGASDLFVVDLATRRHARLTEDLHADLQPAWSPDGRSLAFATDRYSTRLGDLEYGEMGLALLDLETRAVRRLPSVDGKNLNPQWTPDGRSLLFVSDHGGPPNVHRLELESGEVTQVTDLPTGVSGITRLSPALAVARATGSAVFSVYQDGGYRLQAIEDGAVLAGRTVRLPAPLAAVLPPALGDAQASAVQTAPLPDSSTFRRARYRAGLSLDAVGQVGLGVAAGGGGGLAVGGGSAVFWSDMLGDHNLATQFQISSAEGGVLNNLGAIVSYANLKRRWNWGLQAAQIPYFTRFIEFSEDPVSGIGQIRDTRYWEIDRQVQGIVAYPLSRAQRAELGFGLRNIDIESEVETQTFDLLTGQLLNSVVRPGPEDTIPSLNLVQGMAALVYDTSIFGGTSPLAGQRYRLELSPVSGDLRFTNVLADFRRYQRLAGPFTLAGRGLHYGRYGRDSETDRIARLFLGYPWIVRGYDAPSFTLAECEGGSEEDCPAFDRLFGSRMAVTNLELRMPLLGTLGLFPTPGVPPVEAAAFYDAGVAWTDGQEAAFLGGTRRPVSSHGGALRVNLLGFAVAEIAYVHPNQRPVKGWYWLFSLQPGF